jgi:hypothetical protein
MNKFLRFFNKSGEYCNFQYDEANDKWIGRIDFHTVSEGLAQVEQLYMLEEVFNTTDNKIDYSLPVVTALLGNVWTGNFTQTPLVDSIFLFNPTETDLDKITSEQTYYPYQFAYTTLPSGMKSLTNPPHEAIQFNFGFIPSSESGFQTMFTLRDSNGDTILELTLYGEGEGEDERLRDLLMTLGCDILPTDSIIFDASEVEESNTDWSLINRKRKELLLEYQNIFPYVGSYKALINILKFYGYQNVRMKEYWKNVDMTSPNFGKLRQTNIIDLFSDEPDPQISKLIPSKIYKKTNLFGLFYDITVATNEYDEDGIPIVEEVYTFTPEEVLIKLFALKRKLIDYYLPLNAKIIDIIGEAIYFANYRLNVVTSQNRIDSVSLGIKPKYEIYPGPTGLIEDLRPLQWLGGPIGYDLGASAYTQYKVWRINISSGATVSPSTAYAHLHLKLAGMTAGRVNLFRDANRGRYTYTQQEIVDLLVDSYNNPSYIPGYNNQTALQTITNRTYAYAEVDNPGWIRVVEKIPVYSSGATMSLGVSLFNGMAPIDAPNPNTVTAIDPSAGGSFGSAGAPISFFETAYIGYFENMRIGVTELNDAPDIPIGYPIILKNKSFDITWDDANATYDQVDVIGTTFSTLYSNYTNSFTISGWTSTYPPINVTPVTVGVTGFPSVGFPNQFSFSWENLGYYGHVEMQWIVTKDADDTPAFYFDSGQKTINEINNLPLVLPYVGRYTVKLRLWDLYNTQSFRVDEDVISVGMLDSDFLGWYSKRELEYNIDTPAYKTQQDRVIPDPPIGTPPRELTWNEYGSTWDLPLHPNEPIEMAEISANSLDSIEFYQSMINPVDNPLVDRYAYTWNLTGEQASWDDMYHLWWDNTGTRVVEWKLQDFTSGSTGLTGVINIIPPGRLKDGLESGEYGRIIYNDGPTGWQGATSNATSPPGSWVSASGGYTAGTVMYVKSEQAVFIHNGTEWERTAYEMDAVKIPVPLPTLPSLADKKTQALSTLDILNSLSESSYPILTKFIYYYNEKYNSNATLIPGIQAVSKDFDVDQKYLIKAYQLNEGTILYDDWLQYDDHAYSTNYFGYLGDIPAHFEIATIPTSGGSFIVEYLSGNPVGPTNSYNYSIPAGITTLAGLCNELNGSTAQSLPIIGDFVYNMVYGASGWTGGAGPTTITQVKMQGVLKRFTSDQIIRCTFGTGVIGTSYGRSLIKNPTWDNLRIYKYAETLPLLTTVNFTYDNCKIKGKTKSTWKLTKEDDLSFSDIYYNNQYFSYMFNQRGSYSLSLTIEDSNGNKKTVKKPEIIKIV